MVQSPVPLRALPLFVTSRKSRTVFRPSLKRSAEEGTLINPDMTASQTCRAGRGEGKAESHYRLLTLTTRLQKIDYQNATLV